MATISPFAKNSAAFDGTARPRGWAMPEVTSRGWFDEDLVQSELTIGVSEAATGIGAITAAATGTVRIACELGATLGAVTCAATGTVTTATLSGELTATLADVTIAATGAVIVAGTCSATLGGISCVVTGATVIGASLAATLEAVTVTSTGKVIVAGALGVTVGAVTSTSAAAVTVAGGLGVTIANVTSVATGTVAIAGELGSTLGAFTCETVALVTDTYPPDIAAVSGECEHLVVEVRTAGRCVGATIATVATLHTSDLTIEHRPRCLCVEDVAVDPDVLVRTAAIATEYNAAPIIVSSRQI